MPMLNTGSGDFIRAVAFFFESADVYVVNSATMDAGYLSRPYVLNIQYKEW